MMPPRVKEIPCRELYVKESVSARLSSVHNASGPGILGGIQINCFSGRIKAYGI